MSNLEMSMQTEMTMMSVHADLKWDCWVEKSNVRADLQREVSEMIDWLMQIQMHESKQRRQLGLMIQIRDNCTHADEWQNMYKELNE
jgi:ribosomal protein S13